MAILTWRNVDAPDMGSSLNAIINANKNATDSISKALGGVGDTIDQYKQAQTSAADKAIAVRRMAIKDPEAYKAALASDAIVGDDLNNASVAALQATEARYGTLLDQASKVSENENNIYNNNRIRTQNEIQDAASPFIAEYNRNLQSGMPQVEAEAKLFAHPEIQALDPSKLNQGLSTAQAGFTNTETFNRGIKLEQDTKSVNNYMLENGESIVDDAGAIEAYKAYEKSLEFNPERGAMLRKQLDPTGQIFGSRYTPDTPASAAISSALGDASPKVIKAITTGFNGQSLPDSVQNVGEYIKWNGAGFTKDAKGNPRTPFGLGQMNVPTWIDAINAGVISPKDSIRDPVVQNKASEWVFNQANGRGEILWDKKNGTGRWAALEKLYQSEINAIAKLPFKEASVKIYSLEHNIPESEMRAALRGKIAQTNNDLAVVASNNDPDGTVAGYGAVRDSRDDGQTAFNKMLASGQLPKGTVYGDVVELISKIQQEAGVNAATALFLINKSRTKSGTLLDGALGNNFSDNTQVDSSKLDDFVEQVKSGGLDRQYADYQRVASIQLLNSASRVKLTEIDAKIKFLNNEQNKGRNVTKVLERALRDRNEIYASVSEGQDAIESDSTLNPRPVTVVKPAPPVVIPKTPLDLVPETETEQVYRRLDRYAYNKNADDIAKKSSDALKALREARRKRAN